MGAYFFLDFGMGAYSRGDFKIFLVVGYLPVKISLLVNHFLMLYIQEIGCF